jgi:hypothetical protein
MQRITQQRYRSRHQRDGQFDEPGNRQPHGADCDSAVGLAAFAGIVGHSVERKTCRRVADAVDLMHTGKDGRRRRDCQDFCERR